jgi:hypothetical protein
MCSACSKFEIEYKCMKGFWCDIQKERDHYKDLEIGGRIIYIRS